MRQSRVMSLAEAIANAVVGYGAAVLVQIAVFPVFGIAVSVEQNLRRALVCSAVSIARSFLPRRLFEVLRRRTWLRTLRRGRITG